MISFLVRIHQKATQGKQGNHSGFIADCKQSLFTLHRYFGTSWRDRAHEFSALFCWNEWN